ncbi:MAG: arylesterase [Candidatus Yonathbacteria bacterium CG10_big_fil_rev_8_21_14_0_10_43_136]|uniref:Arylesterase n=2 Tax=Parcubacteria group TaxID=1794811 RepID=A0A2M7Q4W5_9BACT|nr:MAG: arylesterase [Candidatus Yonathbacteria bacterium CG10_big_fil_rev_8_21_14_0_10_43_136]PIX57197.1 MAG: arylesterase [Candidatus Yonathbacteria bacterium CG_4_10_14_3_um_filter_43_12]PIY58433.1 MAG: arylesterase [Candidatus Yonathbacteria bacterium CG_4_10_14_0_8_um_filter_43_17]PJC22125.1 MAG: arylesterase [Candidatus Yonathbacteria bacterium CG_4_9_14_0_2_um_filter_43_16]
MSMRLRTIILDVIFVILVSLGIYYFSHTAPITNYPSKGTDIIAFGDSLVEGLGSTSGNDFVSLLSRKIGQPIINLGHAGDTTADSIARISKLNDYNPKVVLLLLGGNDHLRKIPITDTHKNLAVLIENIQARGAVVLLLGVRGGLFNDKFDTEFEALRNTYHTAFVSDVLDGLFGNDKYMSDVIHPNDIGYAMIADRIYTVLIEVLK